MCFMKNALADVKLAGFLHWTAKPPGTLCKPTSVWKAGGLLASSTSERSRKMVRAFWRPTSSAQKNAQTVCLVGSFHWRGGISTRTEATKKGSSHREGWFTDGAGNTNGHRMEEASTYVTNEPGTRGPPTYVRKATARPPNSVPGRTRRGRYDASQIEPGRTWLDAAWTACERKLGGKLEPGTPEL